MTAKTSIPADLLRLVSRNAAGAEIRFGECETVIRLKISTDDDGMVRVVQSHWISPPDAGRYGRPQPTKGLNAAQALASAIGSLSSQFRNGLAHGHVPNETWFIGVPILVGM